MPAFLLLGIGGTGVQVSLMHTSGLFPKHKSNVTNAVHACFQLSFLIFAFFQFLYTSSDGAISSSTMFLVFAAVAVLCLVAGLFWPARAYGGHGSHKNDRSGSRRGAAPSIILPPGGFHRPSQRLAANPVTYATTDGDDASRKAALVASSEDGPQHPHDYHLGENGKSLEAELAADMDMDSAGVMEEDMVVVHTAGVLSSRTVANNQQRLVSKSIAARVDGGGDSIHGGHGHHPSASKKAELDPITATFKQQILACHLWACVFFVTIGIVFSNSFIATLGAWWW